MLDSFLRPLTEAFAAAQQSLFEALVQPVAYYLGFANLLEDAFVGTGWVLVGMIQIAFIVVAIGALERWRPVEAVTDRRAVRLDIAYTLIHRLGLFRLALFFTIDPVWDGIFGELRLKGLPTWHLDQAVASWWPGVTSTALFAFFAYLVVFDFVDYWLHRGQHGLRWWWGLHSLHHSQRQMTKWSDNRSHLLDDLVRDGAIVVVAHLIGIAPAQFVAVIAATQLLESLAHANARIGFGAVLERAVVSPRFHRLHHSIGLGHESKGPSSLGGHNFAVLFPIWDILFGTADFAHRQVATGVRDQLPEHGGRDYGSGFWRQQWLGLKRMVGR